MRETNNNRVYEERERFAGGCEENNGDGGECAFEGWRVESGGWFSSRRAAARPVLVDANKTYWDEISKHSTIKYMG